MPVAQYTPYQEKKIAFRQLWPCGGDNSDSEIDMNDDANHR